MTNKAPYLLLEGHILVRCKTTSNFRICSRHHQQVREQDGADKIFLQFLETGYLDVTKPKEKQLLHSNYITHIMCYLVLQTYNFLTTGSYVPSIFACLHSTLMHYICSLKETMLRKFREISGICESRFGSSEKFQNGSINLLGITSEESWSLISCKTCFYWLKILENIEI